MPEKGLSNWKAPLDVKQPNGNTQYRKIRLVLSTNKKSVSFHVSEWPFTGGAFFMFMFGGLFIFFRTSIHTIALIQGGFLSTARKTDSRQDNGAKSVTKTCNHIIDSSLECPFFITPSYSMLYDWEDKSAVIWIMLLVSFFLLDSPIFLQEILKMFASCCVFLLFLFSLHCRKGGTRTVSSTMSPSGPHQSPRDGGGGPSHPVPWPSVRLQLQAKQGPTPAPCDPPSTLSPQPGTVPRQSNASQKTLLAFFFLFSTWSSIFSSSLCT